MLAQFVEYVAATLFLTHNVMVEAADGAMHMIRQAIYATWCHTVGHCNRIRRKHTHALTACIR
jgi:hypothetical protein